MHPITALPNVRTAYAVDRAATLLPLLRSLTTLAPGVLVWKNADPALAGIGDVDLVAPRETWDAVVEEVRVWAAAAGLGPMIVCRHLPEGMFVVALDGEREFFQLDVRSGATFRGGTVFRARDLLPLAVMDRRGFRRLRPGAEGVLKLVLKGLDTRGRPKPESLRSERVLELVRQDPVGVRAAAALFAPAGALLVAAAERYGRGGWTRVGMLAVELACRLRMLHEPRAAVRRSRRRAAALRECPVLQASIVGRRHPPVDRAGWLSRVAPTHDVLEEDAAASVRGR